MVAALRQGADQRAQEARGAGNQRGGDMALANQPLRAVKIGQHAFQQIGALNKPAFQGLPFVSADHQREVAQRPGTFHAAIIAIDAVGDAIVAQIAVGGLSPCAFVDVRLAAPKIDGVAPGWPNRAGIINAFVKGFRQWRIAIEKAALGRR